MDPLFHFIKQNGINKVKIKEYKGLSYNNKKVRKLCKFNIAFTGILLTGLKMIGLI